MRTSSMGTSLLVKIFDAEGWGNGTHGRCCRSDPEQNPVALRKHFLNRYLEEKGRISTASIRLTRSS
jgi:hypothetical protein